MLSPSIVSVDILYVYFSTGSLLVSSLSTKQSIYISTEYISPSHMHLYAWMRIVLGHFLNEKHGFLYYVISQ